jgi:ribosomal protein L33
MDSHIYLVTNTINGKQYVGQSTINRNKVGHGEAITKAYTKYGKESFTYEKIVTGINNRNTLNYLERFWIKVFNTRSPNGYNIEEGGSDKGIVAESTRQKLSKINKGKHMPLEVRQKISESLKGEKNPFYGKTHSKESLKKMSLASSARKGTYKTSEQTKKILSELRKGSKNPMYGKPITEEHRAKLKANSARNKPWLGKKFSEEHKAHLSVQKICPHCNKVGKGNAMIRHHMDNCKLKVIL